MRALTVRWGDRVVGALTIDDHGDIRFVYDPQWLSDPVAPAISISLPKRADPFSRRECRPFFDGLLPEEGQREALAAALKVSKGNEFALLERIGGDVAGALTLWPEGEAPPPLPAATPPQVLNDDALLALLDRLPVRPMLAGESGLRLSLAGAQSKLPVVLVDGAVALPAPGQPTTHILKPPIPRFCGTTENEALAMRLAAATGLSVAPVAINGVGDRRFLLVERYDRRHRDGVVERLHQEDFCQALGYPPTRKYANEGGPGFQQCFGLLRDVATRPALEVLKLLDAAIFNVVIGNADAHGKNYSLIYRDNTISMAPLYDLLSTVAYPELSPTLAMTVAKRGRLSDIGRDDWDRFAKTAGLGPAFVRRRVREVATAIRELAPTEAEVLTDAGGNAEVLRTISGLVIERAALALRQLAG